ncbi:MAG: ABC transporter permease [Opitutaceae bacterium]|jgi:ribose transport system permease protein|nr:ABC transporter permease [Opitutaceae bacterium]
MSDTPAESSGRGLDLRRLLVNLGPLVGLLAVYALFAALRFDRFVTWSNSSIMLQQTAVIGTGAIGMTLIVISGGVDLSFGSIIAFSAIVVALLLQAGFDPALAALAAVGAGAGAGFVSGALVTRLRLMPFIVTLGMMGVLRGAAKGLADEQPIYPEATWLNDLMQLGNHSLPGGVWVMLVMAVVVGAILRYTRFGRHCFAIGSSEATARLCGIRVERTKTLIYAVGAAFAGLAGVLQFSYLTGGDPTTAVGLELNIIASVVIGGASLAGGRGTIVGTLVGALIMTVVNNGCTKLEMANWVQEIVTGGIIVAAVTLDQFRRGRFA